MFAFILLLSLFSFQLTNCEILSSNLGQVTLNRGLKAKFYAVNIDDLATSTERRNFLVSKAYQTQGKYLGETKGVTQIDTDWVRWYSPYIYGFYIDPSVDQFVIELRGYYKIDYTGAFQLTSMAYGSEGCTEKVEPTILSISAQLSNAVYLNQTGTDQICYDNTTAAYRDVSIYNEVRAYSTGVIGVKGGGALPILTANTYYPIRINLLSSGSALKTIFFPTQGSQYHYFSGSNLLSSDNEDYDAFDDNSGADFPGNCPQFTLKGTSTKKGLTFNEYEPRLIKRNDCPTVSSSSIMSSSSSEASSFSTSETISSIFSEFTSSGSTSEDSSSSSSDITSSSSISEVTSSSSISEVTSSSSISEITSSSSISEITSSSSISDAIPSSSDTVSSTLSSEYVSSEFSASTSSEDTVSSTFNSLSESTVDSVLSNSSTNSYSYTTESQSNLSSCSYILTTTDMISLNPTLIPSISISYTTLDTTTSPQNSLYTNSTSTNGSTDDFTINVTDTEVVTSTCKICDFSKITSEPLESTAMVYSTTVTKCPDTSSRGNQDSLSQFPSVLETSSFTQVRSGTSMIPTASIITSIAGHAAKIQFKYVLFIALMLL